MRKQCKSGCLVLMTVCIFVCSCARSQRISFPQLPPVSDDKEYISLLKRLTEANWTPFTIVERWYMWGELVYEKTTGLSEWELDGFDKFKEKLCLLKSRISAVKIVSGFSTEPEPWFRTLATVLSDKKKIDALFEDILSSLIFVGGIQKCERFFRNGKCISTTYESGSLTSEIGTPHIAFYDRDRIVMSIYNISTDYTKWKRGEPLDPLKVYIFEIEGCRGRIYAICWKLHDWLPSFLPIIKEKLFEK